MVATLKKLPETGLCVFPMKTEHGPVRLDANATLELAILGASARRMASLDRVVDTVWCLLGDGWCPPREVVLDKLQNATRTGTVLATESWVRSIPFLYSLTARGADRFEVLMNTPIPRSGDPTANSAASVKFGLLDLIERGRELGPAGDLRAYYHDCRGELEKQSRSLAADRTFLKHAVEQRIARLDFQLDSLTTLIDTTTRQRATSSR